MAAGRRKGPARRLVAAAMLWTLAAAHAPSGAASPPPPAPWQAALEAELTDLHRAAYLKRCPPVAFIKRDGQGRHGTNATMHGQGTSVGSAICVYDPTHAGQGARTIFEDKQGFIFDMSPSFDGRKILFAYKKDVPKRTDSFHIYEVNADGTGLRQVTSGRYHDFSPAYLPDGRIVFCSTRVESFSLCQDYLACSLFTAGADGSDIRRIEYNTLCALTPFVRDDGSVLYTRWEYQDKNIFCTEGLWTVYPDGTKLALYYGNTLTVPNAIYGAKQIPGTDKVVAVMAGHHPRRWAASRSSIAAWAWKAPRP